jgi:hypothetical protein
MPLVTLCLAIDFLLPANRIRIIAVFVDDLNKKNVGEAGLEPATPGFGDRCSSQLSYTPTNAIFRTGVEEIISIFG